MKSVNRPTYFQNFSERAYQGPDSSLYKVDTQYHHRIKHWPEEQILRFRNEVSGEQIKMVHSLTKMALDIETLSHVIFVKKVREKFTFDPRGWHDEHRDEYDEDLLKKYEKLSLVAAEKKLKRMSSKKSSLHMRFLSFNTILFTLDYTLASRVAKVSHTDASRIAKRMYA